VSEPPHALFELLPLLRCVRDAGQLVQSTDREVKCSGCGATFAVRGDVLDLLVPSSEGESAFERGVRNQEARISRGHPAYRNSWDDDLESETTMRALGELKGLTVLELGCGPGFYTRRLAAAGARVIALDFSEEALKINAANLPAGAQVALVLADVSTAKVAPKSVDLAVSTLYSNLPTGELRRAANRLAHEALGDTGRYFVSAHHHHLRRFGKPKSGRYEGSAIFFQGFTAADLRGELEETFSRARTWPICVWVPWASRLIEARASLSRLAEMIPGLNKLGLILLAEARK
jgi:SAM-dependent methyltransferase